MAARAAAESAGATSGLFSGGGVVAGQAHSIQQAMRFQDVCVQDDGFLSEIVQTSCTLFHTNLRPDRYPRTLEQDFIRAIHLANRPNYAPFTNKVRWFFLQCSDPARIAWEGAADPHIAASLG